MGMGLTRGRGGDAQSQALPAYGAVLVSRLLGGDPFEAQFRKTRIGGFTELVIVDVRASKVD